jgi:hypothetical protein
VWYRKLIQKIQGIRWTTVVQGVAPEDPGHLQDQLDTGTAPEDPAYPWDSVVQGVATEDPGHLQDQLDTGAAPEDTGYPLGQLVTLERSGISTVTGVVPELFCQIVSLMLLGCGTVGVSLALIRPHLNFLS